MVELNIKTDKEFNEMVGKRNILARIRKGEFTPKEETKEKIARELKTTVDWLETEHRVRVDDDKSPGVVRDINGLYVVTQEVEIDGKKHTLKLPSPEGVARKLPPDMAIQNALKMVEKYVDELRKKELEIGELKAHLRFVMELLDKEERPGGLKERRKTWKCLKKSGT